MSLIIFLFKVSDLELPKVKPGVLVEDQEPFTDTINEGVLLFCAKVSFRGINLWSNNVPIQDGTASFVARGNKPKKFSFNLATVLLPTDRLHIEFYTITAKKNRKKLVAIFDLMLESLINTKYIDLKEENLSNPNNYILKSTVQLKVYYTSPDLAKEKAALEAAGEEIELVDWGATFDDEGRHGGHRTRHTRSKNDSAFKKLRRRLAGREGDADTDSYSDTEFDPNQEADIPGGLSTEDQLKKTYNNLELLEKSLGRYEGDIYRIQEWQIMVHIVQGRDFAGLEINPYVCVQIDDQKRYTGVQRSTNSPFFGEFFTFDFNLPATQIMDKVIYFKVHHETKFVSTFTHTKPIGIFKVDVATVYNEKDHAFERKWAQLVDPNAIQVTFGHLLLSVAITERGVSTKNILGEVTQEDDELSPSKTFIPSAMPRSVFPVQLKITFYTATELPEMMTDFLATVSKKILRSDAWEPVDPYVEITYNAIQATTDHRNGTSPVWGEAIYLIGQFPPLVRTMKIALKDRAAVQQDRIISSFLIDLFSISESNPAAGFLPTFGPTWMFLYGSPREYTINKNQDGLGQGMGEGVCYKGRLLMEIECHPISGDNTSNANVQKQSGIQFPDATKFPSKRTFLLFGCIFDVTMIDKEFGNAAICFELSIGSSGYMNPAQLLNHEVASSLTRPYPRVPIDNNTKHFRLPIDLQKPFLYTKYIFHDYTYRMVVSNRLKRAADYTLKLIREFELSINARSSNDTLMRLYRGIEIYVHTLPCGCGQPSSDKDDFGILGAVHPTLSESLSGTSSYRMNTLDEKRHKKILHNLETLKGWVESEVDLDETKRSDIIKKLYKIPRALKRLAMDIQPSLPDVFLWMICDAKRVAYVRIPPEDLLYSVCQGEKGLYNGRVQTLFLRTPNTSDKPIKSATNAKVQIYLWLGTEDKEANIFKQLPRGFDMPKLPLSVDFNYIRYHGKSLYEIRCHCYRARSLIASDETGLSDPFLSITAGNETQTTPALKESLCPQWNITLVFKNLPFVGTREIAEEIVGNVVVECYDHDEGGGGSELIGRFSTTAKLDLFKDENASHDNLFRWYEFKFGDNRAGELLALFELIEVNPETQIAESLYELYEIPITAIEFPPEHYVTKTVKNLLYEIPEFILPPSRFYEIDVMFWGLRECRSINFQAIQQADVSIECAGVRITKSIKNVQKDPNFESSPTDADKYRLRVSLPTDKDFWPHISINCVQNRYFGMKEVVGNLVITDIQKYLDKSIDPSSIGAALAKAINNLSKTIPYDFNRVRRSVVDAYEASIARKDKDLEKKKLTAFEKEAGEKSIDDSVRQLVTADVLAANESDEKTPEELGKSSADLRESSDVDPDEPQALTTAEKLKRTEMEKTANWWTKYYASKARLKLEKRSKIDLDDIFEDSQEAYAQIFAEESNAVVKKPNPIWVKTKQIFTRADKARADMQNKVLQKIEETKPKSAVDESLDLIENDRLKELTLLQTFDIVETELEAFPDYEGFTDCFDKFPLYKGKGTSRSDVIGDEKRVYAKFKGKFRIREIPTENIPSELAAGRASRVSMIPVNFNAELAAKTTQQYGVPVRPNQMLEFDFNRNPITFKCRLYIIKALLFRSKDQSGKADPFIKIALNNDVIINDVSSKIHNTLEPIFGKSYEFEVTVPHRSLLRIQIWDWDLANSNDKIAETSIDLENRWLSCHRATCGLPKRYDSAGYNAWRDTKTPTNILNDLCQTSNLNLPVYSADFTSLAIDDIRFNCDLECIEFLYRKSADALIHRKAHHETPEEYIRQNTALAALHGWGKKINPNGALVAEHIECRSLFDSNSPDVEQGKLEMWLDFFPMSRPPSSAPVDITPPTPVSYQLRLIIWNTSDVELEDENFLTGEKSSDIYVKVWIIGENEDAQQTDVHYRSLTGEGNFNWRMIFDFNYLDIEEKIVYEKKDSMFQIGNTVKKIPPRVVIRVYDADLISADDFLGQCILDMTHLPVGAKTPKKCKADMLLSSKHKSVNLFKAKRAVGWWPMVAPIKPGEIRDTSLLAGKVEAEFSLVTAEDAEKSPVGRAHEGPSPLDEPNRPKTSFLWFTSPWKTFRYVLWRNFKWHFIIAVVLIILIIFLLLAIWSLPGAIMSQISVKIFGGK